MGTDSSSDNPYRSPVEVADDVAPRRILAELDWTELPEERIGFSFHLTLDDVRRCLAPRQPLWVIVFLLALSGVALLLVVLPQTSPPPMDDVSRHRTTLLVMVAGLWCLGLAVVFAQHHLVRSAVAQTPSLMQASRGCLSAEGVHLQTDDSQAFITWSRMIRVKTNRFGIALTAENWRLVSVIIPWGALDDEPAARAAIASVAPQVQGASLGLDRQLKLPPADEPMFAPVGPHVGFGGAVTAEDVMAAVPGRRLQRTVRRIVMVGALLVLIALGISAVAGLALLVAGVFALLPICWLLSRAYRHPLRSPDPDLVLMRIQGWIGQRDYATHAYTGQDLRQLDSLSACSLEEHTICLRLPGSVEAWQFLPRTLFSSDEDFEQAQQWIREAVPPLN